MKIRIRPDDASMLRMNDWLAELRDDGSAEPLGDGGGGPACGDARPDAPAEVAAEHAAPAERAAPAEVAAEHAALAERAVPAEVAAEHAAPAGATVRAVIGDQLRMPIMWCELGSCISWFSDPAALGEGDARARAIRAGWRIDAFGRLACPRCQQTDPGFRVSHPVVPWDRHTAIASAAWMAARPGNWPAPGHPAASTVSAGPADAPNVSQHARPAWASLPGAEWHPGSR